MKTITLIFFFAVLINNYTYCQTLNDCTDVVVLCNVNDLANDTEAEVEVKFSRCPIGYVIYEPKFLQGEVAGFRYTGVNHQNKYIYQHTVESRYFGNTYYTILSDVNLDKLINEGWKGKEQIFLIQKFQGVTSTYKYTLKPANTKKTEIVKIYDDIYDDERHFSDYIIKLGEDDDYPKRDFDISFSRKYSNKLTDTTYMISIGNDAQRIIITKGGKINKGHYNYHYNAVLIVGKDKKMNEDCYVYTAKPLSYFFNENYVFDEKLSKIEVPLVIEGAFLPRKIYNVVVMPLDKKFLEKEQQERTYKEKIASSTYNLKDIDNETYNRMLKEFETQTINELKYKLTRENNYTLNQIIEQSHHKKETRGCTVENVKTTCNVELDLTSRSVYGETKAKIKNGSIVAFTKNVPEELIQSQMKIFVQNEKLKNGKPKIRYKYVSVGDTEWIDVNAHYGDKFFTILILIGGLTALSTLL